jgi:hypothetical protein
MNKYIFFLLLSFTALVFAGCSAGVGVVDSNSTNSSSSVNETLDLNESNYVELEIDSEFAAQKENVSVDGQISSNGTVVVESGNTTASASVDDSGTIVVESNVDLSNVPDVELTDWCIPGQKIDNQVDANTSVSFVISGIEIFKAEEYCLSTGIVSAGGMDIPTSIYAKDVNSEFWVVTEFFGQIIEKKIVANSQ